MKLQIPSSKLQRSTKHQARKPARCTHVQCLKFGISLVLGCWSLVLSAQSVPLDFSTAGYASNERTIPIAPVRIVVAPIKGDGTTRIQQAIDHVASLPLDTNGLRGAVLLLKGRHEIFGGLVITNSGVVLRGQGVNETTLVAAGLDRRTLIRVLGKADTSAGQRITITEDVPVGTFTVRVADTSGIRPMSPIRITRPR